MHPLLVSVKGLLLIAHATNGWFAVCLCLTPPKWGVPSLVPPPPPCPSWGIPGAPAVIPAIVTFWPSCGLVQATAA